jgi:hypothetical protein
MRHSTVLRLDKLVTIFAVLLLAVSLAGAKEQQLAGIRLGQHAINLIEVYGQPDGIVSGAGGAPAGGTPAEGPALPGSPEAPGGVPGGPSPEMGPPEAAPAGPGDMAPGAGAPAAGPAAGGAAVASPFPLWAMAVWVELKPGQTEWIYNKGPVVLGFVLDRDGYVDSITVVGEQCNYARTALWRPHQYIKLGDDYKRVLFRYGYPDEEMPFTSSGPGSAAPGGGPPSVSFEGASRSFTRDVMVRYTENNNITFTLHNLKVTRIQIWR